MQRQVTGPAASSPGASDQAAPNQAPSGRAALGTDPASAAMLALAGFGTPHLRGRMSVADEVVLFYAGLFAARPRPPGALQAMLADYLGMPVRVEPFSGRWVAVAAAEQTRLPRAGDVPRYASLGIDTVAGARIWDVQGQFRVVVGPVDGAGMRALMPDQPGLRRLVDLVRAYAGIDLGFDVQVMLRADCVPALEMVPGDGPQAPRLGWNSWAKFSPAGGGQGRHHTGSRPGDGMAIAGRRSPDRSDGTDMKLTLRLADHGAQTGQTRTLRKAACASAAVRTTTGCWPTRTARCRRITAASMPPMPASC